MVTIGDLLDPGELLLCDIFAGALALLGDDAVGGLVTCSLLAGNCWDDRTGRDDLVGLEALDFGDSLGVGSVAGCVEDEEFVRCLLGDDTTENSTLVIRYEGS